MSQEIKDKILKHLSTQEMSWSEVIRQVSKEVSFTARRIERAMSELIESGKVERKQAGSLAQYSTSSGAIEGKYKPFTERRLEMENVTKSGTYEDNPMFDQVGDRKAV